jgi:hypothetical protein
MPAVRNHRALVADPRLQVAVNSVDEVAAVILRVEAEDRAAEQPFEHLLAPRANAERFRIGPRDVPERDDRRFRQPLVDEARQQREVIVLDENDWIIGFGFFDDRLRKPLVDANVLVPVARAKHGPHMSDVA